MISSLLVGPVIKPSKQLIGSDGIYKSHFICLFYGSDYLFAFILGNNGIHNFSLVMFIGSFSAQNRRTMFAYRIDRFADSIRMIGHDKESFFLIPFIENMQYLCGCILINNGIQSLVKSKQKTSYHNNNNVKGQNKVPGVHALFF